MSRTNWVRAPETKTCSATGGATDGYHPQFVHGSIFSVTGSPSVRSIAISRQQSPGTTQLLDPSADRWRDA